jgi:putative DNA primase/helicase
MAEAPEADALLDAVVRPKVKAAVAPAERPKSPRETAEEAKAEAAVKPEPKPPAQPAEPPPEDEEPLPLAAEAEREQNGNEPEAKSEPAAAPDEPETGPVQFTRAEPPPVLSPGNIDLSVQEFLRRECKVGGARVLLRCNGSFWLWNKTGYVVVSDEEIEKRVNHFLRGAKVLKDGQEAPFNPMSRHVQEVFKALKYEVKLPDDLSPPRWIVSREPAHDWIVFRNKIVNVETGETREQTPDLWAHGSADFDWDPEAKCPVWDKFLADIWDDDQESKNLLEEFLGYSMTYNVDYHKALMMIGKTRGGKSTIGHVACWLVGWGGYTSLSFDTWVSTENSSSDIIGKRLGLFPDVRLKEGTQYGERYDAGGLTYKSRGQLVAITGGDPVSFGTKFAKQKWVGIVPTKVILISNEVPNFNDKTLGERFLKLYFTKTFAGQLNIGLKDELRAELSGIAARCLAAYWRLRARRKRGFIEPQSSRVLERQVAVARNPVWELSLLCFEADNRPQPDAVLKQIAYAVYRQACLERGKITYKLSEFAKQLKASPDFAQVNVNYRYCNEPEAFRGIRLTSEGHRLLAECNPAEIVTRTYKAGEIEKTLGDYIDQQALMEERIESSR